MTYRNQKWLQAVRDIGYCMICKEYGVQAAHRNYNKGMGMKTSDCLTAALCPSCHFLIDNGKELSREERRAMMDRAIVNTLEQLVLSGKVELK